MDNDIVSIQKKYGVTANGANLILYIAFKHPEISIHQIVGIWRHLAANHNGVVTSDIMRKAIMKYAANKMSNARLKIPGDNQSTRGFMRPGGYDEHGNRPLEKDKKKQMTYLPVHKLLSNDMSHELPVPDRVIPPKYFYLDLDEKFDHRGNDIPPTKDPQFRGYGALVPFIEVTHIKTISPSRREVPLFINGEPAGMGIREGKRYYNFKVNIKGESKDYVIEVDYADNVGVDSTIGRDQLVKEVRNILSGLMTPRIYEIYNLIKIRADNTLRDELEASKDIHHKNVNSHKQFTTYYGEDFKNDRKRKSTKPSPKRKTVIRKPVKKLIKKCDCTPTQKRKLLSIKKKIVGRKRK